MLPRYPLAPQESPTFTSPMEEKKVRPGGRREGQRGGLRTFPSLLDVPGQQRAQVCSGFSVRPRHRPQLPAGRLLRPRRPRARGVRGRRRLRQGARRQDGRQQAQAHAAVHGCGEQREGDVNEEVRHPWPPEEGRTPKVQGRGLSPEARDSGSASTREPATPARAFGRTAFSLG